MDKKWIMKKHAYYYEILEKMGKISLTKDIGVSELDIPRGMMQTAYNDIKKNNYDIGLIDFLCLVSTEHICLEWMVQISDLDKFKNKVPWNTDKETSEDYEEYSRPLVGVIETLFDVAVRNQIELINFLRLFSRNSSYFYNTEAYKIYAEAFHIWINGKCFIYREQKEEVKYIMFDSMKLGLIHKFISYFLFRTQYVERISQSTNPYNDLSQMTTLANYFFDDFERMLKTYGDDQ